MDLPTVAKLLVTLYRLSAPSPLWKRFCIILPWFFLFFVSIRWTRIINLVNWMNRFPEELNQWYLFCARQRRMFLTSNGFAQSCWNATPMSDALLLTTDVRIAVLWWLLINVFLGFNCTQGFLEILEFFEYSLNFLKIILFSRNYS